MYTNTGESLYMLDLYPLVPGSRIIDMVDSSRKQSGGSFPYQWRNLGKKSHTRQSI